jgi:hypothetical protein
MRRIISIILIFAVLIGILIVSKKQKEGFLDDYCGRFKDCVSCADASGCAWCPNAKACLTSTLLKSTDTQCNQMNTVQSAFLCDKEIENKIPPEAVVSNDIMYDYTLYKNKITDKIPPPNVYTTEKVEYSPQDIMANMSNIRNDLQNYQLGLPGIISSSVENQIKPMVKGVLAENYYIQG